MGEPRRALFSSRDLRLLRNELYDSSTGVGIPLSVACRGDTLEQNCGWNLLTNSPSPENLQSSSGNCANQGDFAQRCCQCNGTTTITHRELLPNSRLYFTHKIGCVKWIKTWIYVYLDPYINNRNRS